MRTDQLSPGTTHSSSRSGQERERLRADVERARAQLGETVAALASKADVKARAKKATRRMTTNLTEQARNMVQTGRHKVSPVAKHAQPEADGLSADGRTTSTLVRGGAVAGGVTAGAASVAVWMRRRGRRPSRWQQTVRTAQQTGEQLRGKATGVATALRAGDLTTRTAAQGQAAAAKAGSRARAIAASPTARTTAQSTAPVAAVAVVLAVWWLRRRRGSR